MDREHWTEVGSPSALAVRSSGDPVGRFLALLEERAPVFATSRFGSSEGIELRLGQRGLLADETASFLWGLDAGLLTLNGDGGVEVRACRPKPGGGSYSLFSANRFGGDLYVSLNLEYLIQFGAVCELVAFHEWPAPDVEVEVGEFDAVVRAEGRVVLAMEAKARVDGPDSLTRLSDSFVRFGLSDTPPEPSDNHSRKYVELLRLTERGPVVVWLVAAQARWAALARRVGTRIAFEAQDSVSRTGVLATVGPGRSEPGEGRSFAVRPNVAHALEVGLLTELDGQQRCYEFPWPDEHELGRFVAAVRERAPGTGLLHSRAWKWRAASSGGAALTPSGRITGLELRFSYYPK